MLERKTAYCDPEKMATDGYADGTPMVTDGTFPHNVVTSLLDNGKHALVLDLDFPAAVVPSSTPGHFHLYLDKELDWWDVTYLLGALQVVRILGEGYVKHSLDRGAAVVRMPWVNKARQASQASEPQPAPGIVPVVDDAAEPF